MPGPLQYKRLAGAGNASSEGKFAFRHRAYIGSDHVLLVKRSRYSESYRRLYLDDIQGVFYNETDEARTFNAGTFSGGVCAAVLAFVFLRSPLSAAPAGLILSIIASGGLFIALAISLMMGPSVRCWIRTGRGATLVPNVGRLRPARRFAQSIEDAVAMRQGVPDQAEIDHQVAALQAPVFGEPLAPPTAVRAYRLAWIILLSEAVYAGLTMAAPEVFPPGIWILFTVVACVAILMGLFLGSRQRWRFTYRALFTASAYYTTGKVIFWGLYWFLLTTEQIVAFQIYREDLLFVGGMTIAVNGFLGGAGLLTPAEFPVQPPPPAPAGDES